MPGSDIARGDAGSWTVEKGGEAGAGGEKKGEEKKGGEDDWGAGRKCPRHLLCNVRY